MIKLIATFFYLGYLPFGPGTMGSLAGILIYVCTKGNRPVYAGVVAILTLLGFLVVEKAQILFKEHDSRKIVIDEVCGMLLCFSFVPFNYINLILGFALFRIFDITKPFPIKKIEALKGGAGIMLDDIMAAVYTNIILHIFCFFIPGNKLICFWIS